ncbi:DUF3592 domain-containing protein [Caldimonas brevitalea]|uniref:DUF3592 domain-containing protein n=1 Tax=Caldimonas brevitalea TaxID=413882 RepID=UPI003AA915FC
MPERIQDIADDAALSARSERATGTVVTHAPNTGKYAYRSKATVAFTVGGKQYINVVEGAGALPDRLPLGTAVDVLYLPNDPSVSRAATSDAETSRITAPELAGLWLLSVLLVLATFFVYRPRAVR